MAALGVDRGIDPRQQRRVRRTLAVPYLLNIALFLLLFSVTSTFLYFEQMSIAGRSFPDRGSQTAFFATVDLAVNVLTLLGQLFLTERVVRRVGVGWTLALLPAASVVGFAALALSPTVAAIVAIYVARRAGNFAFARPIREVLFIPLTREDRYKAKNVLDTTVYRLGDQIGAWAYAGVTALGAGGAAVAILAVPLSLAWLVNSLWLGRRQGEMDEAGGWPHPEGRIRRRYS